MQEIETALADLIQVFTNTPVTGKNKAERTHAFVPIAQKIEKLKWLAFEAAPSIEEGIYKLEQSYKACFRITETNGHGHEQHLLYAESAIRSIKRQLGSIKKATSLSV